jgi:hypothetical protein
MLWYSANVRMGLWRLLVRLVLEGIDTSLGATGRAGRRVPNYRTVEGDYEPCARHGSNFRESVHPSEVNASPSIGSYTNTMSYCS